MFTFFWQAHRNSHSPTWKHANVHPVPPPISPLYFPLLVIISPQKLRLLTATPASVQAALQREQKLHSAPSRNQAGQPGAGGEAAGADGRPSASVNQPPGRKGSQRGQKTSPHSPAHSSDSAHSQHAHRGRSSRHRRR